jgi:hypothetical protein
VEAQQQQQPSLSLGNQTKHKKYVSGATEANEGDVSRIPSGAQRYRNHKKRKYKSLMSIQVLITYNRLRDSLSNHGAKDYEKKKIT